MNRLVLLTMVGAASVFAQGLPTTKVLTLDLAQAIAQGAFDQCHADGYKIAVKVVDAANLEKLFLRDDGAGLITIELATLKANSVIMFQGPSGPPANAAPGAVSIIPGTIYAKGGFPIKVGDQLIGAVAVSGAPGGDKDAACAAAGLAKAAGKLK